MADKSTASNDAKKPEKTKVGVTINYILFKLDISLLTSTSVPSYGVVPQLSFDYWPMAGLHLQT